MSKNLKISVKFLHLRNLYFIVRMLVRQIMCRDADIPLIIYDEFTLLANLSAIAGRNHMKSQALILASCAMLNIVFCEVLLSDTFIYNPNTEGKWSDTSSWTDQSNQPISNDPSSILSDQIINIHKSSIMDIKGSNGKPFEVKELRFKSGGTLTLKHDLKTTYINKGLNSTETTDVAQHNIDLNGNTLYLGNAEDRKNNHIFGSVTSSVKGGKIVISSENLNGGGYSFHTNNGNSPLQIGTADSPLEIEVNNTSVGFSNAIINGNLTLNGGMLSFADRIYGVKTEINGNINVINNASFLYIGPSGKTTINGNINMETGCAMIGSYYYDATKINGDISLTGKNASFWSGFRKNDKIEINGNVFLENGNFQNGCYGSSKITGNVYQTGGKFQNSGIGGGKGEIYGTVNVSGGEFFNADKAEAKIFGAVTVANKGKFFNGKNNHGYITGSVKIAGGTFTNSDHSYFSGTIQGDVTVESGSFLNNHLGSRSGTSIMHQGSLFVKNTGSEANVVVGYGSKLTPDSFTFQSGTKFSAMLTRESGIIKTGTLQAVSRVGIANSGVGTFENGSIIYIDDKTASYELIKESASAGSIFEIAKADDKIDIDISKVIAKSAFVTYKPELTLDSSGKILTARIKKIEFKEIVPKKDKGIADALENAENVASKDLKEIIDTLDKQPTRSEFQIIVTGLNPHQYVSPSQIARGAGLAAFTQMSQYRSTRRLALLESIDEDSLELHINPMKTGFASAGLDNATILADVLPLSPGERYDRQFGSDKMINVFARATTGYTRVGNTANRIGLSSSRVGAIFGIDIRLHDNFLLGFTGSYDYNNVKFNSGLGGGRVNSYRFGPYAMLYHNEWFFEAELTIGLHDNKFTRHIPIAGKMYSPTGKYGAIDFTTSVGVGYDFDVNGLKITPRLNLQYQYYQANKFEEKNGGGANLVVYKYNTNSFSSHLSVEFWKRYELDYAKLLSVTPFASVGWRREWLDPGDLTSRFAGGGSSFNIDNDLFSRDIITLGAGCTFELSDQCNLDLRYQADIGTNHSVSQNAYIAIRYKF